MANMMTYSGCCRGALLSDITIMLNVWLSPNCALHANVLYNMHDHILKSARMLLQHTVNKEKIIKMRNR